MFDHFPVNAKLFMQDRPGHRPKAVPGHLGFRVVAHAAQGGLFLGQAALGFIDALERGYTHIGRHPGTGSPRHGHELDLPGLRAWALSSYPYLVFYIERPDHIDVWRVLHGQRDIPAWMQDPDTLA